MISISVDEIQSNLQSYLARVEAGETLIITREDMPVAEMKPVSRSAQGPRPFGLCAGQFTVPDDFDDSLPEEILRQFEGA